MMYAPDGSGLISAGAYHSLHRVMVIVDRHE